MTDFEDRHLEFVTRHYKKGAFDTRKALGRFCSRHHIFAGESRKHSFTPWLYSLGGIAAAVLFGIFIWKNTSDPTVTLTAGDHLLVYTLPDNSQIKLAPGSSISYDKKSFANEDRRVDMTGTVYFEVHKDAGMPFEIFSEHSFVKVLGTEFQVKDTPDSVQVNVINGKVMFSRTETTDGVILTKGMQASLLSTAVSPNINMKEDKNATAWERGTFIFEDTPLDEVLKTLSSYYGIKFTSRKTNKHLTGEFDIEEPELIADLIGAALGIKIQIKK